MIFNNVKFGCSDSFVIMDLWDFLMFMGVGILSWLVGFMVLRLKRK